MKVDVTMIKAFKLLSLPLILSLMSCEVSKEESEKAVPTQTESEIVNNVQIDVEPLLPPVNAKRLITLEGFEDVTFGMSETEIRAALKGSVMKEDYADNPDCYYLYQENIDVFFMMYSGTLQRIDIWDSTDFITKEGAGNGMSFEAIEKIYANAHRKPNFYTHPSEDLIVQLDENTKVIFEQGINEAVRHFRIGKQPSIDFVEGCL